MTVLAMANGPLKGKPVITTAAAPAIGYCNVYNSTIHGSPLVATLPQLNGLVTTVSGVQTLGAIMQVENDPLDATGNPLTFNCFAGDTFSDGSTSLVFPDPGMQCTLSVLLISSALKWKIIGGGPVLSQATIRTTVRKTVTTVSAPTGAQVINTDSTDIAVFSSAAAAFSLATSGTPYPYQTLSVYVTDNGTSQAIAFDMAKFGNLGVIGGLPATTPAGRRMRMDFFWDSGFTRWILAAIDTVGYAY